MCEEMKTETVTEDTADVEQNAEVSTVEAMIPQGEQTKKKSFKKKLGGALLVVVIIIAYVAIFHGDEFKDINSGGTGNGEPTSVVENGDSDDDAAGIGSAVPTTDGMTFGVTKSEFLEWFGDISSVELKPYDDSERPVMTAPHSSYFFYVNDQTSLLSLVYDDNNKVQSICCNGSLKNVFAMIGLLAKNIAPEFDAEDFFDSYDNEGNTYTDEGIAVSLEAIDPDGIGTILIMSTEKYEKSLRNQ